MTYISVDDVRRASGAPSSLISDATITSFIELVEPEMERWLNTKFVPTEKIDILTGSGSERIFTTKNPLLAVRELSTNSTDVSVAELEIKKSSGKITLANDAEVGTFLIKDNDTIIKYLYGLLEDSTTSSTTSAAETAGTDVSIALASITGFSDEDWCEIVGMDGFREVFQINGTPAAGAIVADQLIFAHESGSTVTKLQIPYHIKRYMEIEAAIGVAINAIGATYTFNASYSLGELSVVKGVPYTHWRESVQRLVAEREMRQARIKPRPYVVVG